MNNKNIVVGVSCLYPSQYPKSVWGNREKDYYLSMKSLLNLNIDFDFMFIDNSINDINEIKHEGLKNILIDYSFDYSGYAVNFKGNKDIFSEDHNIGYEKLILSIIDNQYILNHDFITILNLRRYFISSFWFFLCEKLLFSEQHDILLLDSKEYKMENMEAISKQSNISIEDNLLFNE